MKPFAVFDIETDPFKAGRFPQPFMCGFYDGKTTTLYHGPECVKRAFKTMRKYDGYVYAHNGGKFDFKYLLPFIPKTSTLFTIKGRIAKIAFGEVEFRDSYLVLPVPLKAYGKLSIDYRHLESAVRHKHLDEIKTYLKADLHYLYEMIQEFVADYGFGLTMAGRTFAQLKEKFDIVPPKTDEHYDTCFREFYYGGRVQFFELGKIHGKFRVYDINSAYPAAMVAEHVFGTVFLTTTKLPRETSILNTCFIKFRGSCKGGLPWHAEDGSLSFAPHEGTFAVTGWELAAAKRLGLVTIKEVEICHRPLELKSFRRYVEYFYRQKRAAKKGSSEELFAKLFLNSCYGRFALNPREFRDVCMTRYDEEPKENVRYYQADPEGDDPPWTLANDFESCGLSIWEKPARVAHNAFFNVATAASITGKVRAFLLESLASVKRPVYCDTDCIICERADGLRIGGDLGDWKEEGELERDSLWIAGKKLYAGLLTGGKWKTACKGVRLSPEDIIRVAEGTDVTSTLDAPTFSLLTGEGFVTRTVRRDDRRKRRKISLNN